MRLKIENVYTRHSPDNVFNSMNYEQHVKFLYKLLKQREPHQNISHKELPPYHAHQAFVGSKPYLEWNIVYADDEMVGAFYLTRDYEIGIFVDREKRGKGMGDYALKWLLDNLRGRPVYANINPNNERSIKFFMTHGFKLHKKEETQNVYILY